MVSHYGVQFEIAVEGEAGWAWKIGFQFSYFSKLLEIAA